MPPLTVELPKREQECILERLGLRVNILVDEKDRKYVVMVVGPFGHILWQYRSPYQKWIQTNLAKFLDSYDKGNVVDPRSRRSDAVHIRTKQTGNYVAIATKVPKEVYDEFTMLVTLQGKTKHEVIRDLVMRYIKTTKVSRKKK